MKKLSVLLLTFYLLFSYSVVFAQIKLPIIFTANEKTSLWLGIEWDYKYKPIKDQINVIFDGSILKMYSENKVIVEKNILSYVRKEEKKYGKLESEIFILKCEENDFTIYIVIKLSYDIFGDQLIQIKIPNISETGEIMYYDHYQQF
jgi:hypothetical protein